MTIETLRPEVLGRLLIAQQTIEVMPDAGAIAAFVGRALAGVPGVIGTELCCSGRLHDGSAPESGDGGETCAICRNDAESGPVTVCARAGAMKWLSLPVATPRASFGFLNLDLGDEPAFLPYRPYLLNIAAFIGTILENRALLEASQESNRRLEEARNGLEQRVRERTARLAETNRRLEAEIRERQQAEERAHALALHVRTVLEACPDPIVILDQEARISDLNPAFEQATGRERVQLIGRLFPSCFIDPTSAWRAVRLVLANGRVHDQILGLRHASGPVQDLSCNAALLPEQPGRPQSVVVIGRDLTDWLAVERERTRSRRVFQMMIDATEDPIMLLDRDCRIRACNRAAASRFRFHPAELVGVSLDDLLPAAEVVERRRSVAETLSSGLAHKREFQWRERTDLTAIYPVAAAEGGLEGVVIHSRDITRQKQHEQEIELARRAAEQANIAKSQFLAAMSHELRTPLNAILGFSEIIANQLFGPVGSERYAEYAADILASGQHLLELVGNILEVSRLEAGTVALDLAAVDVGHLFRDCLRLRRDRLTSQELSVQVELAPGLPYLWADERGVRQILQNLLSNAIKFTPPGGRIQLAARPAESGGIILSVSDTGIGIPAGQLGRVTEPFERVDNRYSRATAGTGLGLALVSGLVRLHRGTVSIDSTVGLGTTVSVWFPPRPLPPAAPPPA
jgi:PAS domain S-box-containing protein